MSKNKEDQLEKMRHSCAHLLAAAVVKLWPDTKLGIGPAITDGFYYDFRFKKPISEEDLPKIEFEMRETLGTWKGFEREEKSINEAKKIEKDQPFKLDLIREFSITSKRVSFYKSGNFSDLCKGGHVKDSKKIGPFKLLSIAGAYWRGSEKNPMLTRIYGTCFENQKKLDEFLGKREKAKENDHKKIGKELDLFSFHSDAPGFVFWHPKGMMLREALMKLHDKLHKRGGYLPVSTPILLSEELWHKSGHWDNYKDEMYFSKGDKKNFVIKPMNCPGAILIYKNSPHSYKDLPLRLAEWGEVHRQEPSGTLNGLFRIRAFRQDDAHIFVTEDQMESEIEDVINLTLEFYKLVGFENIGIELSTRPDKFIGDKKIWEKSEDTLKNVLRGMDIDYKINEGEGAFYGPKIDFHINDALSRSWQCGTIQLDFSMPERFKLEYIDKDGAPKRPVMIHRTVVGSIQRFIGILVEHFGGAFPTWLTPIQVKILPIADRHQTYAAEVLEKIQNARLRSELDDRSETLQSRIRDSQVQKIPYMLIVGDREKVQNKVAVRSREKGDQGTVSVETFIRKVKDEERNFI